jgi:glycogen(starch) synthase
LRLAILTSEYPPLTPYDGGIGSLYAPLAPSLARLDQDIHVFALTHGDESVEEHDGVQVHLVSPARSPLRRHLEPVAWSASVARAIRRAGPFDVVMAPEWFGSAYAYSRRRDAGPLVTQLCTSLAQVAELNGGWPRLPVQKHLERRQTERSDTIFTLSQAVLDWAGRLWDLDDVPARQVPSAIDVAEVRGLGDGDPPGTFPEGGPRVVFFGRLEPLKGVDDLVQAMSSAWDRFPAAQLVMLGGDDEVMAARLRELAGPNADQIRMLGFVSRAHLLASVRRADVVALPSLWETFTVAGLEAMALGRPVVLTAVGGTPEFCTDGVDSLLVPPSDPEALGRAIARLLEDTELRERIGNQAAKTAEQYAVPAVAPRYVSAFEDVLAGR